jgi:hypothetical protein
LLALAVTRDGKLHGVQPKAHESLGDFATAFDMTTADIEAAIALAKALGFAIDPALAALLHPPPDAHPPENHHADHRHAGGADARLEQIARLNDRTRLGLDRSARFVITRNLRTSGRGRRRAR